MGKIDYENENLKDYSQKFALRLSALRNKAGVSARKMSLDLNRNQAYINSIENSKYFPTMKEFFCICDYLEITPSEFFMPINGNSIDKRFELHELIAFLSEQQLDAIHTIISDLVR